MNRWASALPPPQAGEAVLDIVSMLAKYGKKAEATGQDAGSAAATIVRQMDRLGSEADDVLRQLIALDKAYADEGPYLGLSKVDLDWLGKNLESGRLGARTDVLEELTRFTKIGTNEDDAIGPNSTLFRFLKSQAGGEATTNIANKVKSVLANKDVADSLRQYGSVTTEVETAFGKFVDCRAILSSDVTLTVKDLDTSGSLITRTITVPAGTPVAVETKALALDTWDIASNITAQGEVFSGYRLIDPGQTGIGESFVAATPDILEDEAKLIALLQKIREQPAGTPYTNRSSVIVLTRRSMGAESYNDLARGLIRSLSQQ